MYIYMYSPLLFLGGRLRIFGRDGLWRFDHLLDAHIHAYMHIYICIYNIYIHTHTHVYI